ncbi:unnamed protein product, partial [Closterium sp. NIES-54]
AAAAFETSQKSYRATAAFETSQKSYRAAAAFETSQKSYRAAAAFETSQKSYRATAAVCRYGGNDAVVKCGGDNYTLKVDKGVSPCVHAFLGLCLCSHACVCKDEAGSEGKIKWRYAPTTKEERQWAEANRKSAKMVMAFVEKEEPMTPEQIAQREREQYEKVR